LKKIKVGRHSYKLIADRSALLEMLSEEGEEYMGRCDNSTLCIYVDDTLPVSVFDDTLLHECTHALVHHSGLSTYFEDKGVSEEYVVTVFATALHSFIVDNPELMNMIVAGAENG